MKRLVTSEVAGRRPRDRWRRASVISALMTGALAYFALVEVDRKQPSGAPRGVEQRSARAVRAHRPAPASFAPPEPAGWQLDAIVRGGDGGVLAGALACVVQAAPNAGLTDPCTTTDSLGRFALQELLRKEVVLLVSAHGHVARTLSVRAPESSVAARELTTIHLRYGGTHVEGSVVDLLGGAVARAMVIAQSSPTSAAIAAALSGLDGRFSLPLSPGSYHLTARADGYAPGATRILAPADGVVLGLVASSTIIGSTIADSTGEPIADVAVTATTTDGRTFVAKSGGDGRFVLENIPAGSHWLSTASPDWWSDRSWLSVPVGAQTEEVVIPLYPATHIAGTVAVERIPCSQGQLEVIGMPLLSKAIENGAVQVHGLPSAPVEIELTCDEPPSLPLVESLSLGLAPHEAAWALHSRPRPVAPMLGAVRVSVAGGASALTPALRNAGGDLVRGLRKGEAFMFGDLPLGPYDVHLTEHPEIRRRVVLGLDREIVDVKLELAPLTSISGTVVDAESEPIGDAWVRATDWSTAVDTQGSATALTNEEGEFTIAGVLAGSYSLQVDSSSGRASLEDVEAGASGILLRVAPQGLLAGRVTHPDGSAALFTLWLRRRDDTMIRQIDGKGVWSVPWLRAGTYDLVAASPGGFASATATLIANGQTEVPLVLRAERGSLPDWAAAIAWRQER